jgi:hypothetical protein
MSKVWGQVERRVIKRMKLNNRGRGIRPDLATKINEVTWHDAYGN